MAARKTVKTEETNVVMPVEETTKYGIVVNCELLNVRENGNTTANVITTIPNGTKVEIVSSKKDWYKVVAGDTTGFVMSEYINVD